MKVAILHEMLIKLGGAEKVVESILRIYPNADLYTLIYDEEKGGSIFLKEKIHPSCKKLTSQKIYNLTKKQRLCLPFMNSSVKKLDFSSYDRVIISSSGFAHGLQTGESTRTIVYYHAPARYMWDWAHEYRREINMNTGVKGYLFGKLLLKLRMQDYESAQQNDILLSNSKTTQGRVQKYFRRGSHILYPPIETQRFAKKLEGEKYPNFFGDEKYYIILSTLTEFKKLDIAISAFKSMSEVNLLIIGAGEYKSELEKLSGGQKNIQFSGAQYGDDLVALVQNSLGLVFPGEEDFGIVPIEIMAAGKPVFALHKGGLTETVIAGETGDFFQNPDGSDFIESFNVFHKNILESKYTPNNCKKQAAIFDESVFHKKIQEYMK